MKARRASEGIRTTGLGRVQSSVVSAETFAPVPDFTPYRMFRNACHHSASTLAYTRMRVYVGLEVRPMEPLTTRVFMNGNSQAVRIPAQLRIDADRDEISRTAEGDLLLHPVPLSRGQALLEVLEGFDDEFMALLEQSRAKQLPMQERESL